MQRIVVMPALFILIAAACADMATEPATLTRAPSLARNGETSNTECIGALPPGAYHNVVVPPGQSCEIGASVLSGYLKAFAGSRLVSINNRIDGNVEALGAAFVHLDRDVVGGNIHILHGPGQTANFLSYRVMEVTVPEGHVHIIGNEGDILFMRNRVQKSHIKIQDNVIPALLNIFSNEAGTHMEVSQNTGPGSKFVQFNTAGRRISCFGNTPPFFGLPNTAPELEGQCGVPPTP
jgi:hypothetical protein